jgi:hypothetical protein
MGVPKSTSSSTASPIFVSSSRVPSSNEKVELLLDDDDDDDNDTVADEAVAMAAVTLLRSTHSPTMRDAGGSLTPCTAGETSATKMVPSSVTATASAWPGTRKKE